MLFIFIIYWNICRHGLSLFGKIDLSSGGNGALLKQGRLKMIIAKAYESYISALNAGLSEIQAVEYAINLWSHTGLTKSQLVKCIAYEQSLIA